MGTGRLEAFSDGVIAILITIMVLELRTPAGGTWSAIKPVMPILAIYLLSFVVLAIYWNNHHHMLTFTDRVNGSILWANMHLLFWLSLVPFGTKWEGQSHFSTAATTGYGIVLLGAAFAYYILQRMIVRSQGADSKLAAAIGTDVKGKLSPVIYAIGIGISPFNAWVAVALYAFVAAIWLIPDRRIETRVGS